MTTRNPQNDCLSIIELCEDIYHHTAVLNDCLSIIELCQDIYHHTVVFSVMRF